MAPIPDLTLRTGDTVILEGRSQALDRIISGARLQLSGKPLKDGDQDLISIEAVISRQSPLSGLSVREIALSYTRGINLLPSAGVASGFGNACAISS